MADSTSKSYSSDPALYLYTSLTSGSSHIVTATSRLETILKANRIPFRAIDIATDEKARMLWGRRSGKDESGRLRKIPGLVQMGLVIGDLVEIEDWNEYGELKQHVTIVHDPAAPIKSVVPTPSGTPSKAPVAAKENDKPKSVSPTTEKKITEPQTSTGGAPSSISLALRQAGAEAAQKAKDNKTKAPAQTFDGVGEAEPTKETAKAPSTPKQTAVLSESNNHTIDTLPSLQSPTSTAWKSSLPFHTKPVPGVSFNRVDSVQSPSSTAWKPTDINGPITMHRGSSVTQVSRECIKQIEEEQKIVEESSEEEISDEEDGEEEDEEDEDTDSDVPKETK